jgi:hypothetical protein
MHSTSAAQENGVPLPESLCDRAPAVKAIPRPRSYMAPHTAQPASPDVEPLLRNEIDAQGCLRRRCPDASTGRHDAVQQAAPATTMKEERGRRWPAEEWNLEGVGERKVI